MHISAKFIEKIKDILTVRCNKILLHLNPIKYF